MLTRHHKLFCYIILMNVFTKNTSTTCRTHMTEPPSICTLLAGVIPSVYIKSQMKGTYKWGTRVTFLTCLTLLNSIKLNWHQNDLMISLIDYVKRREHHRTKDLKRMIDQGHIWEIIVYKTQSLTPPPPQATKLPCLYNDSTCQRVVHRMLLQLKQ